MKLKAFKIRLADDFRQSDEEAFNHFALSVQALKTTSNLVAEQNAWSVLLFYNPRSVVEEGLASAYTPVPQKSGADEEKIFETLRKWRLEKSESRNVPAYCIATNENLRNIARIRPLRKEHFQEIKGFGKFKIENYGEDIINILENT